MKIFRAIFLIVTFSTAVSAAPLNNLTSSAYMAGDSVIYNLDFIDPFGLPVYDISVKSKSGSNEYTTVLDHLGTPPYYLTTYEGTALYQNPSDQIEYYGRVEADTFILTRSYKNQDNQFPPNSILYAELANDPVGDTLPGTAGQWLDLTGSAITYSDTRIYARLSNAGGGWPTNQGFDFFAYAFLLYNPENTNMTATALVYINIPFFFSAGLYSVDLQDTSFSRIADIQYQTDGNDLHLSCAVSDLLLDPNWSQWPPEPGFALTGGLTLSIVSLQPSLNDYTFPAAFIPETGTLNIAQNSAPVLADYFVDIIPEVSITPSALYFDGDNNLPVEKYFVFDDVFYNMGSFDHKYSDSSYFETSIPCPSEDWHFYYFRYSDGVELIETELDSVYLTPISAGEYPMPLAFNLKQNYPNPFNAETSIEFELADESWVEFAIYDLAGRHISTLISSHFAAGPHRITWNGRDFAGQNVSSGVYFYQLKTDNHSSSRKMVLLR